MLLSSLPPDHPHFIFTTLNLAALYKHLGKLDLALPLFDHVRPRQSWFGAQDDPTSDRISDA